MLSGGDIKKVLGNIRSVGPSNEVGGEKKDVGKKPDTVATGKLPEKYRSTGSAGLAKSAQLWGTSKTRYSEAEIVAKSDALINGNKEEAGLELSQIIKEGMRYG